MGIVFGEWSFGPVTWILIAGLAVHQVGYIRSQQVTADRNQPAYRHCRYRMLTFVAAMFVVCVAFESPVDYYSATLFWVHMIQVLLLAVVAAPLIVLSAPWSVLVHGLSPVVRRKVDHEVPGPGWLAPMRRLGRAVNQPVVAWLVFTVNFWTWHLPVFYDLTLNSESVHYLELGLFLGTGILFWLQVIDSYPLRSRLSYAGRIGFLVADAVQNWVLALALAFASGPWYSGYAHLSTRPGGISALEDQQIGAGIMWVPGMIPLAIAVVFLTIRFVSNRGTPDLNREFSRLIDAETRADRLPAQRWRLAPRHRLD